MVSMAMKVLLAAAEEIALKAIKKCLVHDGYEVHTADNGVAASRMVETLLPDIVITDISMPEIGGVDLLRWIKKKNSNIEVIMITGYGELKLAIESLKMDAVDFITRPVNMDIVAIAMKRAVDRILTREQLALYTENLESLVREKTRELETSEKRYVQLFNESPAYISIIDRNFRIVEFNKQIEKQFGNVTGRCCYKTFKQLDEPYHNCPVRKTFQDGMNHTAEIDVTLDDGSVRNFFLQSSAIADAGGRVDHVMEMTTDVTVVHQLQEHLAALGLHISSISHGIKGMLTGLDGGQYLISSGIEKKDMQLIQDGWDIAREKIAQIRKMVLDILMHSKDRPLAREKVNVFDFVQELVTVMDTKMKKNSIALELDSLKPNSGVVIEIDRQVLFSALLAILENAVDACRAVRNIRTRLTIKISVELSRDEIVFKIRDNGKGLAREYQEEVFSLFYSDKGAMGTGLGLFIAQRSVKKHNGTIRVDSRPGEFTEFTIAVPVQ